MIQSCGYAKDVMMGIKGKDTACYIVRKQEIINHIAGDTGFSLKSTSSVSTLSYFDSYLRVADNLLDFELVQRVVFFRDLRT